MEPREAVLAVLREEATPMHWTKALDLALRRGYLDPFVHRDVRGAVQRSLRDLVSEGVVARTEKGVYAAVSQDDEEA
jgi:hypothetical protein